MRFYLGAHRPGWLAQAGVPLFVSRSTLADRKSLPRAIAPWALDSGGFSELLGNSGWTVKPATYAADVARYRDEIGGLEWACPQDWMCSPGLVFATGLTVEEHQRRTIYSVATLRGFDLPIIPVLQGWTFRDYMDCVGLYHDAGFDLVAEPLVGIGSIATRHDEHEVERVICALRANGVRLHGLGVKLSGLKVYGDQLASADSMAWSYRARQRAKDGHPSCDPAVRKTCANCLHFALEWREHDLAGVLQSPVVPRQQPLFSLQM